MDLHEAVVEEQGTTETLFATASNEEAAKKILKEAQEQTLTEHKTKVAAIEARVTELYDNYKDVQSKFPTSYVFLLTHETNGPLLTRIGTICLKPSYISLRRKRSVLWSRLGPMPLRPR